MKRLLPFLMAFLLLTVLGSAAFWQHYQRFLQSPMQLEETGLVIDVKPGANIRSVASWLQQQGVTRMDWRWRLLGRMHKDTIKTGEYQLLPGMTPPALLDLLASGKVINYRFTIVEGWSLKQLLGALRADPVLLQTIDEVPDPDQLEGLPAGNMEGWFLPETYVFVRGDSDLKILRRAYNDMQASLQTVWAGRDTGLPYETPYELLIMASIIEKETAIESERGDIAGVFVRRLLKRWRLETDPTVIYGLGDAYDGNIRRKDLKTDTPYNTYTRRGLPPTPIAMPGLASLEAAAHPASGDSMFFVANGQGGHVFSSKLEDHNKAVREMIKRHRDEVIKEEQKR